MFRDLKTTSNGPLFTRVKKHCFWTLKRHLKNIPILKDIKLDTKALLKKMSNDPLTHIISNKR